MTDDFGWEAGTRPLRVADGRRQENTLESGQNRPFRNVGAHGPRFAVRVREKKLVHISSMSGELGRRLQRSLALPAPGGVLFSDFERL